jgi:hypothetical protein
MVDDADELMNTGVSDKSKAMDFNNTGSSLTGNDPGSPQA